MTGSPLKGRRPAVGEWLAVYWPCLVLSVVLAVFVLSITYGGRKKS